MKISRDTDALGEHMVISLAGDFDLGAASSVRSAFAQILTDGWERVYVDVSEVTFADSVALGLLIGLQRRCTERGGAATLIAPGPELRKLISLSGLDQVLPSSPSVEAAVAGVAS